MKNRREFMISGLALSAGLLSCGRLNIFRNDEKRPAQPDIGVMTYCCLECNGKCQIFKATVENDIEAKRAIAANWAKKFGEAFTSDDVFCYGCKQEGKPKNRTILKCTVRKCAIAKNIESCALCSDLEKCDKDLWKNWPEMKTRALKIQKSTIG
jgi:hypothetical protein